MNSTEATCRRCSSTAPLRELNSDSHLLGVCSNCRYRRDCFIDKQARVCGVTPRHLKFKAFEELNGPAEYLTAVADVRQFAQKGTSVLGIVGERGTGKTQVAAVAVWQTILSERVARYENWLRMYADLKGRYAERHADRDGDSGWFREWSTPHMLVIDEITEGMNGEHARSMFTALIDQRYAELRPTILIANLAPVDFGDAVGASIADRCREGGGVVPFMDWPSFRNSACFAIGRR